jgi:hypothetical protein
MGLKYYHRLSSFSFFFLTLDQLQKFGLLTPVLPHPVLAPFLTLLEVAEEMAAQGLCYCASRA